MYVLGRGQDDTMGELQFVFLNSYMIDGFCNMFSVRRFVLPETFYISLYHFLNFMQLISVS
jgi:hypothetical protein